MSTNMPPPSVERQPARPGRIIGGIFILLLVGSANSARPRPDPANVAGALASLTVVLIVVVLATWLIGSGLPRSIAPNTDLKRVRRRIWYKLVGAGLLAMLVIAIALLSVPWDGAAVVAVLVSWLYWFGWTWIAWLIADKRAVRQLSRSLDLLQSLNLLRESPPKQRNPEVPTTRQIVAGVSEAE